VWALISGVANEQEVKEHIKDSIQSICNLSRHQVTGAAALLKLMNAAYTDMKGRLKAE
jgi:hypothetical protein